MTPDLYTKLPKGALDVTLKYFKVTYSVLDERRKRRIFETQKV